MADFHIDAITAYRVHQELKIPLSKFAVPPRADMTVLYSINFHNMKLYNLTGSNKPRRKLNYDQVCMLYLAPVECHEEIIKYF